MTLRGDHEPQPARRAFHAAGEWGQGTVTAPPEICDFYPFPLPLSRDPKREPHALLSPFPTPIQPEEFSDAELEELVAEAVAACDAVTPKDMGKVMGWLRPKVAGRADGKKLSCMVREKLEG